MRQIVFTLFASLLFSQFSSAQCCSYALNMYDAYGDGWNGGANITITVGGVTVISSESVNTCACTSNTSETINFNVCQGDVIEWSYTDGTSYDYENSFTITDLQGNIIASDSDPTTGPTGGTFFAGNGDCVSCSNGIQDGDETGVDCGGSSCVPCSCLNGVQDGNETGIDYGGDCGDCYDGVQNGSETGIDCGGPFCLPCTTNNSTVNSETCCDASEVAIVYPTNCSQIGTSAYNLNSPVVNMTSSSACAPSTSPTGCGTVTTTGTWTQLDLAEGVEYVQLSPISVNSFGNGNTTTYHAYYQGTDCSNLTFIDCQPALDFSSGSYFIYESSVTGLDPTQNLWVYTWNSGNKAFNIDFQAVGAAPASNTSCPGSTALGEACNLGSQGASFSTPGANFVSCTGGNWGSNENTTFYSFTADNSTASLEIDGIICNDGTNGDAQFGVWTSCAAIGTYGSDFLGCAVGTATLSLSPLTPGQTYYIAADGFAGDNCTWGFTGTGIILPIELKSFTGYHNGHDVELEWITSSEYNNDYFTIQRTPDGKVFEDIAIVDGAGTTQEQQFYSFVDRSPYKGTSYYRLKQTDFDGKFEYSDIISMRYGKKGVLLMKTYNLMGQEVDFSFKGMVIDLYSDGSTNKRYQY